MKKPVGCHPPQFAFHLTFGPLGHHFLLNSLLPSRLPLPRISKPPRLFFLLSTKDYCVTSFPPLSIKKGQFFLPPHYLSRHAYLSFHLTPFLHPLSALPFPLHPSYPPNTALCLIRLHTLFPAPLLCSPLPLSYLYIDHPVITLSTSHLPHNLITSRHLHP